MSKIGIGARVWDLEGRAWRVVGVTVARRVPLAYLLEAERSCGGPRRLPAGEVYASLLDVLAHFGAGKRA